MLATLTPLFGVMKFEKEPLAISNWRELAFQGINWLQDAGGFFMVAMVLWILNGLVNPIYDYQPDGSKRNRLVRPRMLLAAAVALTLYLIALGVMILAQGENIALAKKIEFLGHPVTKMLLAFQLTLAAAGLVAIVGFGGPFFIDFVRLRWGRVYAIAKLSFKEAVRRRVVWVFLFFLALYLFPARWFFREKPEDEVKTIINVTTRGLNVLLIAVGLLLASFSIPNDIKNLTIHTIVTKPVERFELVFGRLIGYLSLITAALGFMTALGLALILLSNVSDEAADESLKSRVAHYGALEFYNKEKKSEFIGLDVGREMTYRRYIVGHPSSSHRAIFNFNDFPAVFQTDKVVQLEFAFDIYRTTNGEEGAGVQVTFEVFTHNWDEENESKFTAESQGLVNARPNEDKWAKVDALAEKYGKYVYRSVKIADYHTSAIPIPGGLFRNAATGTPSRESQIRSNQPRVAPRVQVRVKCETPAQYLGVAKYDLYLLESEGEFAANYFKGALGVWFRLVIVITIAISLSTYFAGVLTFLMTLGLFVAGYFQDFILTQAHGVNEAAGPLVSASKLINQSSATIDADPTPTAKALQSLDEGYHWLLRRVFNVIPDVEKFSLSDYVAQGFSIGPGLLAVHMLMLAAYVVPCLVIAYYLIKAREIAA